MDLVLLDRNIARLRRDVRATIFRNRAADCIGITLERRWYVLSRTLALPADRGDFDLHCPVDLRPQAVLRIHSAGETDFATIGRGYPTV
jgi:hypothetical protein